MTIKEADADLAMYISNMLRHKLVQHNSYSYSITYHNTAGVKFMLDHGAVCRRTFDMRMPDVPDEFMRDYFRGFFDSSGCVSLRPRGDNMYGIASFSSISESILRDMQEEIAKYDIRMDVYVPQNSMFPTGKLQTLRRFEYEKLYDFLYYPGCIYSTKKRENFETLVNVKPKYDVSSKFKPDKLLNNDEADSA